jgi:hypothetical protein
MRWEIVAHHLECLWIIEHAGGHQRASLGRSRDNKWVWEPIGPEKPTEVKSTRIKPSTYVIKVGAQSWLPRKSITTPTDNVEHDKLCLWSTCPSSARGVWALGTQRSLSGHGVRVVSKNPRDVVHLVMRERKSKPYLRTNLRLKLGLE